MRRPVLTLNEPQRNNFGPNNEGHTQLEALSEAPTSVCSSCDSTVGQSNTSGRFWGAILCARAELVTDIRCQ